MTGNLGDMVCATPVFRAIKNTYPSARVIVVGTPKNAALLEGHPDVDVYIPATSFRAALRALIRERPDYGIAVNASVTEVGLLLLSDAEVVSFIHARVGAAFRLLSRLIATVPYHEGEYVPRQNLRLLQPLGITAEDTTKSLMVMPEARRTVQSALARAGIEPGIPLIVVAPGAGQAYREWPPERFAALARTVRERYGAMIAMTGIRGEPACDSFLKAADGLPVFDARGQSIAELKALLSLAALVIANDSGPLYIAEALGIPTLAIAGIADPAEHLPRGPHHRAVLPRESGALVHAATSDPALVDSTLARRRLASISVDDAATALDDLWRAILPVTP
jgi:ADP-heptose:LPS heptosyltransferase